MTTTIRITLPIEPGAKTCRDCRLWQRAVPRGIPLEMIDGTVRMADARVCPLFDVEVVAGERLPECLAAERVTPGECIGSCWRVYDADGDIFGDYTSDHAAWQDVDRYAMRGGARVVRVTRYRRWTKP